MYGDKVCMHACPFSGVANHDRVWRKGGSRKARLVIPSTENPALSQVSSLKPGVVHIVALRVSPTAVRGLRECNLSHSAIIMRRLCG